MDYFVALFAAICAAGIAYATLNKQLADKFPVLHLSDTEEVYESKRMSKVHIVLLVAFILLLSFLATLKVLSAVEDPIGIGKMILSLFCMIGAAGVDYREHRIPNIFPTVMALGGIAYLAAGLVLKQNGAVEYATTSVVTAICCAVVLLLASALTKQGIGAGDIKLICSLALIAGVYTVISTLFFGITLCCATAIIALITRRMNFSGALPLGPFLFLGYIVTVLTGNF